VDYKGLDFNHSKLLIDMPSPESFSESLPLLSLPDTHLNTSERVDKILEDEIIDTKPGGTMGLADT